MQPSDNSSIIDNTKTPSIPKTRKTRLTKKEAEFLKKKQPNGLHYSLSQINKYTYNNNLEDNDDEMVSTKKVESNGLEIEKKFYTTSMNRLLDYISRQCETDYGKRLGFNLKDIMILLRFKKIFYENKEPHKAMSILFDVIDITFNGETQNPVFGPLFSSSRSLIQMNRPFSQLKELLSVFVYNKYYVHRFEQMDSSELSDYNFVIISNFKCDVKTVELQTGIKEVNHYTWLTGITNNDDDNQYLRTMLTDWYKRHDALFYKMEVEYPIFYTASVDDFFTKAKEFNTTRKRDEDEPLVSPITLDDKE